ncbi:MAG: hypothetical protein ABW007_25370 [Chitinophagaceae bacterium]
MKIKKVAAHPWDVCATVMIEYNEMKSLLVTFLPGGQGAFFPRVALGDSVYFFCLDAKKVTKKDQGYALMAPPVFAGGQGAFFRGIASETPFTFFALMQKK